jgi:teichuronic acid biosynthesis glycosyltransferase TuaC
VTEVMWITGGYPWDGDPVGGIFFQTQARALAWLGVSIAVVSPTPVVPWPLARLRARWQRYSAEPRLVRDDGIVVVRPRYLNVPGQPSWALPDRAVAAAVWRSRRHWDDAGVIHGHYAVTGLAAWRIARRTGLPFFLTFHGDDMNTWPDDYPDRRADLRAAVSDARGVFAVSRALARRIREVTGVEAIPLPLGCDHAWIEKASLPRTEARRLLGLPEDRVIVLFVGYLQRQKGVRELATAILDLGDPFIAAFVGDGPERGYASDDPRSSGRLLYQGARSHEDVIRHMSAADVLVLPSYGEGLPTVLVEAGSVGLPVIASAVGGIPELLGEDRGATIPDVSAAAVAAALSRFLTRRREAELAAQRLRDHVRAEYDVTTNARHLLAYYRSASGLSGDAR